MNLSAVNSAIPQAVKPASEAGEVRRAGPDHDGDGDDRGAAPAAARPSVNTVGQIVGQHINIKA